jgi:cytoskeletal protein CcmA (bactofilin family)
LESVFAKSTICRACGRHFEIGKTHDGRAQGTSEEPAEEATGLSVFNKLGRMMRRESIRNIKCHACGAGQRISSLAKSSLCPHCGGYIDLRDFKITTSFSRNIQTQGNVYVTKRGNLSSAKVLCGSADIRGKLNGTLQCSGEARFRMHGRLIAQLDCNEVVIEKRSDIEFVRPMKAVTLRVFGKVSAFVNADTVVIGKNGSLEGTIHAKAINVEKGGIFSGELFIGQQEMVQGDLLEDGQGELFGEVGTEGGPSPKTA